MLDGEMKDYDDGGNYSEDILNTYLNESSSYPLLTQEEEIKYATLLSQSKDSKLLIVREIDGYKSYSLNLELLLCSLCTRDDYEFIISSLIDCYNIHYTHSTVLDKLLKYQREAKKLNRALNKEELKKIFKIDYDKVDKLLVKEELLKEIRKIVNYKIASTKMFISNLRLVNSIAFRFNPYIKNIGAIDIMDLISEGNNGLIKAIDNFDVSLGNRFSTYATKCIEQNINRFIIAHKSSVRIPEYFYKEMAAYKKKLSELEKKEGRKLSVEEIAIALSIPIKTVLYYEMYEQSPVYIDGTIGEDQEASIGDFLESPENLEDKALEDFLKEDIEVLFKPLTEKEKLVIKMYFGLGEYRHRKFSLIDIGDVLGVSQQRIEQIKSKAIAKMRIYSRRMDELKSLEEYMRK